MKRRAIDIMSASSATGMPMRLAGLKSRSSPLVSCMGEVARVMSAAETTTVAKRKQKNDPMRRPSVLTVHVVRGSVQRTVPGVRKACRPNIKVNSQTKTRKFARTMLIGRRDRSVATVKKAVKIKRAGKLWDDSAAIMSAIVPINLVRGSSRWIGEFKAT